MLFNRRANPYPHITAADMRDTVKRSRHCDKFHPDDRMDEWLRIENIVNPPPVTNARLIELCAEVELDYRHTLQHAEAICINIARRIGAPISTVPDIDWKLLRGGCND